MRRRLAVAAADAVATVHRVTARQPAVAEPMVRQVAKAICTWVGELAQATDCPGRRFTTHGRACSR